MDRFKQECKKINEQIKPSNDFVKNLKENVIKGVEEEKRKRKNLMYKVAMFFVVLTVVSSGVFAKDLGNWLSQLFSNMDEATQIAIENGYVQNVEMDYVQHDGIGIKVNSLIIDDSKINIVFDVQGEIDGELVIQEISMLVGEEGYNRKNLNILSSLMSRKIINTSKDSKIIILKISNIDYDFKIGENLEIIFNKLWIMKDDEIKNLEHDWKYNILLKNDNFINDEKLAYNYIIEENEYLESYKINMTNSGTKIELDLKKDFDKYTLNAKENIYLETQNGDRYFCRDCIGTKENLIQMTMPITIYDNIEKFNIVIILENEKIILKAQKENS